MQIRTDNGKFDVSLDAKEQLIKLGVSNDLGYCKGMKKASARVYAAERD